MVPRRAGPRDGERSPWSGRVSSPTLLGMDTDKDPKDYERGPDGLLVDPDAARAEARRGWIMLTSMFVGGAILVALAAFVT